MLLRGLGYLLKVQYYCNSTFDESSRQWEHVALVTLPSVQQGECVNHMDTVRPIVQHGSTVLVSKQARYMELCLLWSLYTY